MEYGCPLGLRKIMRKCISLVFRLDKFLQINTSIYWEEERENRFSSSLSQLYSGEHLSAVHRKFCTFYLVLGSAICRLHRGKAFLLMSYLLSLDIEQLRGIVKQEDHEVQKNSYIKLYSWQI